MSIRPPHRVQRLGSHGTDFNKIEYLSASSKICQENLSFMKTGYVGRIHDRHAGGGAVG
jgi:hypothetical protein